MTTRMNNFRIISANVLSAVLMKSHVDSNTVVVVPAATEDLAVEFFHTFQQEFVSVFPAVSVRNLFTVVVQDPDSIDTANKLHDRLLAIVESDADFEKHGFTLCKIN